MQAKEVDSAEDAIPAAHSIDNSSYNFGETVLEILKAQPLNPLVRLQFSPLTSTKD